MKVSQYMRNMTIETLYSEWKSLQPLREEDAKRLRQKFMLEFNYNSNHLEGNTLTYGQTEALLLFGRVSTPAKMKDLEDMKASNVALKMMEEQAQSEYPLTESFIRQLHKTLMREDYVEYRQMPDGTATHYTIHAGIYKTRPNSVLAPVPCPLYPHSSLRRWERTHRPSLGKLHSVASRLSHDSSQVR